MDTLDRLNIEKFIRDPTKCLALVMLKEFYGYGGSMDCPHKQLLKIKYEQEEKQQQERESGLI